MKDFIAKHWKPIVAATVLLIIIHTLFKMPAPFPWLKAVWQAGDIITFVGTIVLGYVAYWQNKQANEQTDKANAISQRLIALEQSKLTPLFVIRWKGSGGSKGVEFSIINLSDSIARDIEFSSLEIYSSVHDVTPKTFSIVADNFSGYLRSGEETTIEIDKAAIVPFKDCRKFEIKILHTDILDIRRSTVITANQIKEYKFNYSYNTQEE